MLKDFPAPGKERVPSNAYRDGDMIEYTSDRLIQAGLNPTLVATIISWVHQVVRAAVEESETDAFLAYTCVGIFVTQLSIGVLCTARNLLVAALIAKLGWSGFLAWSVRQPASSTRLADAEHDANRALTEPGQVLVRGLRNRMHSSTLVNPSLGAEDGREEDMPGAWPHDPNVDA